MKTIILLTCCSPLAIWTLTFAQARLTDVSAASWLQGVSSLGFAGLTWFLLAVRDPKRDKEHREERESFIASNGALMQEHRTERDQWRETMDAMNDRSREAAADGHKAASELTAELRRLTDAQGQ